MWSCVMLIFCMHINAGHTVENVFTNWLAVDKLKKIKQMNTAETLGATKM